MCDGNEMCTFLLMTWQASFRACEHVDRMDEGCSNVETANSRWTTIANSITSIIYMYHLAFFGYSSMVGRHC